MAKQKYRNNAIIGGRLFRDPVWKDNVGKNHVTLCILAINYCYINASGKEWRSIYSAEVWGDLAEQCRGLKEEDGVEVEGHSEIKPWQNKNEKKPRYDYAIKVHSLRRLDSEGNYLDEDSGSQVDEPSQGGGEEDSGWPEEVKDEEIPF